MLKRKVLLPAAPAVGEYRRIDAPEATIGQMPFAGGGPLKYAVIFDSELRLVMRLPLLSVRVHFTGTTLPKLKAPEYVPAGPMGVRNPVNLYSTATFCWAVPTLPLKLLSPEYVAVSVSGPTDFGVSEQLAFPDTRVAEQLTPVLSLTVTFPVGVPEAGAFAATVKLTVTLWARMIEVAEAVTVVAVLPFKTCCAVLPDVLLKLASPA